ncbi:FKBP-type peptidyl-prolyl cis-trans isomerase [Paractinoplanes atraurantiacus]|uniref:FKBP-type peptidyl-prolyl cis-trans isomerase n=1 Tax=Paractinoplanes atraurantiacus TaxID=1036182 RepID=UPI001FE44A8F|nr:FKBP-type peptidyl-prolyl cis-trans isomerase [Actinoplanes atraurantiacus]
MNTDSKKRRGQAIGGAVAGVAVIAVLVAVFVTVRSGDDDANGTAPAAAAPTSAAAPAEAAQPTETAAPAPTAAKVETPAALAKEPEVKAGEGKLTKLDVTVLVPGTGPAVQKGQTITANYKLVSYTTGQVIDSSWSRGEPFSTPIGVGAVIKGWDEGIPGQKVGSRVQLDVPAALAYGEQQGDLRFVVDILAAQ